MNITFDSIFSLFYNTGEWFKNFSTDTHELILFMNGEGKTKINKTIYHYSSPTICFTKAGDVRDHICTKKTDYICLRFCADADLIPFDCGIYNCEDNEIINNFIEVQKEFKQKKYKYFDICNLKINEILIKISRSLVMNQNDNCIYGLIKKIDNQKLFNITVQEMADSVSYSYDHFRHKFKMITGQSPTDYIINKRIEYACMLLRNNKYTCTQISEMCGFSSPAQFSSIFKKKIGISPHIY